MSKAPTHPPGTWLLSSDQALSFLNENILASHLKRCGWAVFSADTNASSLEQSAIIAGTETAVRGFFRKNPNFSDRISLFVPATESFDAVRRRLRNQGLKVKIYRTAVHQLTVGNTIRHAFADIDNILYELGETRCGDRPLLFGPRPPISDGVLDHTTPEPDQPYVQIGFGDGGALAAVHGRSRYVVAPHLALNPQCLLPANVRLIEVPIDMAVLGLNVFRSARVVALDACLSAAERMIALRALSRRLPSAGVVLAAFTPSHQDFEHGAGEKAHCPPLEGLAFLAQVRSLLPFWRWYWRSESENTVVVLWQEAGFNGVPAPAVRAISDAQLRADQSLMPSLAHRDMMIQFRRSTGRSRGLMARVAQDRAAHFGALS